MKNFLLILTAIAVLCSCSQRRVFLYDETVPQLEFAVNEIQKAENDNVEPSGITCQFKIEKDICLPGGFHIQVGNGTVLIQSVDVNGLMYGGLEVAEQLTMNGKVSPTEGKPYIKRRGIKMNIPLDARTPSYDDTGDAAQQNIADMWDWDFWQQYLDQLARDRYNVLTLWNPHPFPSMIKLDDYPEVALDDVCVTTLKPVGIENEWAEPQMVSSNVLENLKVVKTITIDEKIAFWQKVMQYAHDRGIDIYFFTWNLCPNGAAKPVSPFYRTYKQPLWDEEPGKYGITNQMDNSLNVTYYQASMKKFLETYPLIKGIGVTAGEHMIDSAGVYTREQWIWEAYGKPIVDFMQENPERKIDFIHRVWNTDMDKIMKYWGDYPGSFDASFKYAKARLYSTPTPPFAANHIERMKHYGLKSWWNLRNDDIFVHRWGNPDYVRDFINFFDSESTAGFYMGSDGYVWGREFNSKEPSQSGILEIEKHWYRFMLWGRLAYNTQLDSAFFIKKLALRYPETDAEKLYDAWKTSSNIIPKVNCFHWNDWDHQWAVEACIDTRNGFHDINRFIENPTMQQSGLLSPKDYAKVVAKGTMPEDISPYQVAAELRSYTASTLEAVSNLQKESNSAELRVLLDDMRSMSFLGNYYAAKIEGATELALFKETKNVKYKEKAVSLLTEALEHWKQYAAVQDKNYKPQMLARTGNFDVNEIMVDVEKDISKTQSAKAY